MRTEDGQIIHKCLNGDTAAFGLLVDKYKASIYALAYSKLHNFHDAEDVTQEAFIKAFRKLRTLRWWDNFLAWLYAITSNLCKDWIRSQSKRPDREFLADQDYSVLAHRSMDSYQVGLMRESLHDALNSLPEKYRQVLTLHYLGGMTRSEIARFLGISPRTITQRLMEGRARLREEMIAMMSDTYEQQRLTETFTFRIVEMIKRIKIQPVPRISWLPWGLSFAAGVILAILNLTSSFALLDSVYVSPVILTEGQSRPQFHRLEADEAPFASYNQKVEILAYMNMAATSEAISGGNERSQTAEPVGSSEDGQGADETRQPEQLLLAAAPQAAVSDAAEKITIAGKVVKDNSPVPDARVFVYSWDTGFQQYTNSKSDGSFQLEMTKPERWDRMNAIAQHPQYSFGWTKLSEDNTANVIIKLHNPVAITGTVVDESGHPIQGAEAQTSIVSLPVAGDPRGDYVNGDAIDSCTVKTDSQGNFAIRNLPEGANTNFVIIAPGFAMIRKFNVRAGTADLTFSLKPEGRIEGCVTFDETGEPVPGAVAYIRPADFAVNVWAESRTDENGDGNPVEKASVRVDRDDDGEASGHVNVGDRTNVDGTFSLKNLLVDETESIYVGKGKIYKIFHDVKMNQDDVVFVLEESTEPSKPPTPEEMAGREYSRNTWERSEKMPGTTAPELDVAQWLNGEPAMEGKNILLHFWLSQDVRSLESISLINVLQREYGDKGLVCVGIHEATENIDDLRKLMEEKRIEYPVAIDKQSPVAGAAGSTLDRYAVFRFPTFIVIDKEGLIHAQTIGSGRGLEEKVRELVMD